MLQQPNPYLAALLEGGGSGFAGDAAGVLIEMRPDLAARYGDVAFASWQAHLRQQLCELAAAVTIGEPALFISQLAWMRAALVARSQPDDAVDSGLEALDEALARRLPESVRTTCHGFIEHARSQLRAAPMSSLETTLDPTAIPGRQAQVYLQRLLTGDDAAAIDGICSLADSDVDVTAIYRDVLLPAQREIGRRWHLGAATVAEEHLVTATTRRAMAILMYAATAAPANGRTVCAAAVTGNAHDIGLRAVADLYRLDGWHVRFLGADVPTQDLPDMLSGCDADLLLLGATLGVQVVRVAEAIQGVRQSVGGHIRIVVGGAAFDGVPDLWRRIGGDGYAASIDDAVAVGERLVDN